MRSTIGSRCVRLLALGACSGKVTGGEMSRGLPSPAAGDGVTAVAAADSDPMSAEPVARGRAQPTRTASQQDGKDQDPASDHARNARIDDRQRPDDDTDAGAVGSDERDGGVEEDGGARDGSDRACERRCCRRGDHAARDRAE